MVEKNGKRLFSCADCKAVNMPFHIVKKHVLSLAHRKKDRSRMDPGLTGQECKEMRKVTRTGIVYFCQPCAFQTDSVVQNTEHITDPQHKR